MKRYSKQDVYNILCGVFNTATSHNDDICPGIDGDPLQDCTCDADTNGGDLVDALAQAIDVFRTAKGDRDV